MVLKKRINTGFAQRYTQYSNGDHGWSSAPSDAADSTITWTEYMRIDQSTGNIGIGTSSPIYKLHIAGEAGIELFNSSGGGDVLNFRPSLGDAQKYNMSISSYDHSGSGTGAADGLSINGKDGVSIATGTDTTRTERMRITSGGNVGIGTATPEYKLTVIDSISFGSVYNGGVYPNSSYTAADENWGLEVQRTSGVDDYNTRLKYYPSNGSTRKAGIWNSRDNYFTIYSDDDFVPNVIIPSGRLGIGTTSPDSKLHVESTSATGANFILETTHSGGIPLLDLKGAASAQLRYKDELNVIQSRIDFGDSGTFNFIDVPNNNSTLYLKTGGNVGIGTTSPLALLNIEGPNNQDGNDYAQLYIKGTGTYPDDIAGVVLDSAGSHQSHIRFSNNGSPKFQLRYNEGGNTIDRLTFYSFTQGNDMMTLDGATGNVGIGTTTPYNRLHSSGVLGIGTANQTPGLTSTMSGGGGGAQYAGGSIYVIQGYAGVMSSGDTFTFIYEATDWKAWSAEFVFTSTSGMSRGAEGGYNNNGSGHSSEMGTNALGCTASTTNVGQHVKIVFSFTNPGTHPMAKITYSQSGGDGVPRADRVNINWNT